MNDNLRPRHRRWALGALLIAVGWLATPNAVPIYDGVGVPDEPYRYVAPPSGASKTAPATPGTGTSPVTAGSNSNGMSVQTAEQGPQFSLFIPPQALAAPGGAITIGAVPHAPADQPAGARFDGNVYDVTIQDPAGPIKLTAQAAIATLYLRATSTRQPGPVVEYRPTGAGTWQQLKTSRGGQDIYVSTFPGAGQYALAYTATSARKASSSSNTLLFIGGGLLLLVLIVIVIRLRSRPSSP